MQTSFQPTTSLNWHTTHQPQKWPESHPDIKNLISGNISKVFKEVDFEVSEEACNVPFNEILPGLYLGNQYGAGRILGRKTEQAHHLKKSQLFEANVKSIICCTEDSVHYFSDHEFSYIDVPLLDSDVKLVNAFQANLMEIIDQKMNEGGVLIHCAAGMSRSASIMIIYLSNKFPNLSYDQILNFLKEKRPCVQPNNHFQEQLRNMIDNKI